MKASREQWKEFDDLARALAERPRAVDRAPRARVSAL
jgi:hypothetical protein